MFSRSFHIFTIAGIEIRLDLSWFVIAALIVWSLSFGYFPTLLPEAPPGLLWVLGIVAMLGLFGSLLLHELAHALVAMRDGLGIRGITLFLFGGVAELETEPRSAASELRIALAGPAMSFALAAGFAALARLLPMFGAAEAAPALASYLAAINLMLAVFNLLPAFPLDGGRVYRALLWYRSGDLIGATRRATRLGQGLALGLMIAGGGLFFLWGVAGGLWLVLIGLFLWSAARATYQQQLVRARPHRRTAGALMSRHPVTVPPEMTLAVLADEVMLRRGVSYVPVVEQGRVLGYVDNGILQGIDREHWEVTQVGDVFVETGPQDLVADDMPVESLLRRMQLNPAHKLMVVRG